MDERDWTNLAPRLLQQMSNKLAALSDFIRVRAACRTWRNALSPPSRHVPPLLPFLVLPRGPDNDQYANLGPSLRMHDLSESRTHFLYLPAIKGRRICGSSHGWLVLEQEREVSLLNPITRDVIALSSLLVPPNTFGECIRGQAIQSDRRFCIKKAVLSSNPRTNCDCLVMVLFTGSSWETAFCRIRDDRWTTVFVRGGCAAPESPTIDIGYHNNLFYAICRNGNAWTCNISNPNPNLNRIASMLAGDGEPSVCTVERQRAAGVHRFMIFFILHPSNECCLLMLSEEQEQWMYMPAEHSDCVIFLAGMFHSVAIPAADLRRPDGWDGGCICTDSIDYVDTIGDLDWYRCRILRQATGNVESTLVSNLDAFVEADNSTRLMRGPSFLWLTPTLI